jgi:hypothetical protein
MTKPVTWTPAAQTAIERLQGRLFASTTEVCAIIGCDVRALRRGIESGDVPATRVGQRYYIPTAWIREQAQTPAPPAA